MKPIIDLNKEYGLVFDGGGARGAYQIGAWRALSEAGVKISAVAGTSVGALNGALVCMGDLEKAGHIWKEMVFSRVMDVDDELMEQFFDGEASIREILKGLWKKLADGGIDITPLKELIHEVVDEEKIRKCGKEFCLLTFSVSDMKELDLSIEDIPEGLLEDFLLASAYLLGFKNEPLHGKTYIDGGAVNNVPTASLLKRGYKDLIQVRIFGPGRVPKTTIPEDGSLLEIEPRVGLGSILEFSAKRSRQNLKIGYYDAKRALYGLTGSIYYIEETREECYYVEIMKLLSELEKTEYRFKLKLPIGCSDRELFYGMLEASAKLMRIPKYNIYTADELWNETSRKYETRTDEGKEKLPKFVHAIAKLRKDYKMNLKGRSFLTLRDYTTEEICRKLKEEISLSQSSDKENWLLQLNEEKELLGAYISGHPLEQFKLLKADKSITPLSHAEAEKPQIYMGVISNIKEFRQRNDGIGVTFDLEDWDGLASCIVFAQHYKQVQKYIKDGNVIKVYGYFNKQDEESFSNELIARQIFPCHPYSNHVFISFQSRTEWPDVCQSLKPYLVEQGHPVIFYECDNGSIREHLQFKGKEIFLNDDVLHLKTDAIRNIRKLNF